VRRRNPLAATFGVLLIAAVPISIVAIVSADLARLRALSPSGVAALLYLAIAGPRRRQLVLAGRRREARCDTRGHLYLEPLATVALAVPLLGEAFGFITAIGGGLVLAGVYVGQRDRQT
jgi:drug/metabolite transporter (DMT)-like permease